MDLLSDKYIRDTKDLKDNKMDSKSQENYLKKYDEKNLDKIQSRLVFNDPGYLYIFKKTEKVTAALYLITNLVSDSEPIKWQIRQKSLKILSDILSLKRLSVTQAKGVINDLLAHVSEIISLIKIASISNHISAMNHGVMYKELVLLLNNLDSLNSESFSGGNLMLPQDFFNVPEPIFQQTVQPSVSVFSKGQYKTNVAVKDNSSQQVEMPNKDTIKDNRRETIIRLLKLGKPLGIKDFSVEIKGCSEKTIQRELIDMVEKGVLKKTGERRWSVYSLVSNS